MSLKIVKSHSTPKCVLNIIESFYKVFKVFITHIQIIQWYFDVGVLYRTLFIEKSKHYGMLFGKAKGVSV